MNYYFDPKHSPMVTLVSEGHNTRPCPFSGRYTLSSSAIGGSSMPALIGGQLNCHQAVMHAGCSASDDLIVESVCSRNLEDNVRTQWSCHGQWTSEDRTRQVLVLSTPLHGSTSNYVCLSYTEREGILSATASSNSCIFEDAMDFNQFNITSSGPCLQALTGDATSIRGQPRVAVAFSLALLIYTLMWFWFCCCSFYHCAWYMMNYSQSEF